MAEGNGTQRDIGAISASLDSLREYMEAQVRALSEQIADVRSEVRAERFAIQERESRSPDRTINILGLVAVVLVPSVLALVHSAAQGDQVIAAAATTNYSRTAENRDWIGGVSRKQQEFSEDIGALKEFRKQQEYRNQRVDSNADAMSQLAVADKDQLETDALRGLSERIEKYIESDDRRTARLETAVGHLRAAFPHDLPGGDE